MSDKDINTANKIKASANKLFTEKGFGRTTMRDIASGAEVNLALVNYYFKSKDDLFKTVMLETIQGFVGQLQVLLNDDHSFEEKLELVVSNYIDLLLEKPELPIFMLSEIRNNPGFITDRLNFKSIFHESSFFMELSARAPEGIPPLHYFMNLLSVTVFPFAAKPLFQAASGMDDTAYRTMMEARKTLIPQWLLTMLPPKP